MHEIINYMLLHTLNDSVKLLLNQCFKGLVISEIKMY